MNLLLQQLFERIETDSGQVREDHLLALSMILEKNFSGKKSDPAWRVFIPDDLFDLQLGMGDRAEVVSKLDSYLKGNLLTLSEKISCISTLGIMPDFLPALEGILQFLEHHHTILTDSDAYAVLATLLFSCLPHEVQPATLDLAKKYGTEGILEQLSARPDRSLNEVIRRTRQGLKSLSQIPASQAAAKVKNYGGNPSFQNDPLIARDFADQVRFVALLQQLTEAGKLEWARSEHDPGFVYCLASGELIVFELRGDADAALVEPDGKVAGIVSKCRNVTYLWLAGLHDWDKLLDLLRRAPVNHREFVKMRKRSYECPIHALKKMLEERQ